eukprot:4285642-Prymnesium_polylepis.1
MPDDVLRLRIEVICSRVWLERSQATPLASIMTKSLLRRIFRTLVTLSPEAHAGLGRQAALARVVNDMVHGNLPTVQDLGHAGDAMCKAFAYHQNKKVEPLEKALKRKVTPATRVANESRLLELHRDLYHCPYGSTLAAELRPVPDRQPSRSDMDIDRDGMILNLKDQLSVERQKPDVAEKERERAAVVLADAQMCREQAAAAIAAANAEVERLSAQVESLAAQRSEQLVQRAEQKAKTAAQVRDTALTAKHTAKAKEAAAVERAKQEHAAAVKAGAAVVNALVQAGEATQARLRLEAEFETEVERRVQLEVPQLREELDAIYSEEIAAAEMHLKDAEAQLQAAQDTAAEKKRRNKAEAERKKTNQLRLERAVAAEHKVDELRHEIDALQHEIEKLRMPGANAVGADSDDAMQVEASRDCGTGRLTAFDWRTRLFFHQWLARATPPVTAIANYVDAAKHFAPHEKVRQPSLAWARGLRAETTILGEGCAALQVLCAKRIISFGFDETTKRGDGLASTNIQIETQEGEILDVVLRGAFVIPGGTAEQVSAAMETKLFARCRKILRKWKQVHEDMWGAGTWPFPDPSRLGFHQLGGALIMSDTCNAARAATRLIMENAARAIEQDIGSEAWALLSDAEKAEKTRTYVGHCMQHLRNILLDAMTNEATKHLTSELEESLDTFSSYERMSTDVMQLIRAVYKELHHTGEYAKGKQREFEHWLLTHHPQAFYMPLERAKGGRQDLAFDGAVPIYANRQLITEFLHELVFVPGHSNILEDFLWHSLSCAEMVALTRVLTLFDLLLSMPLRWLCGMGSKLTDWSVYKAAGTLDLVEGLLVKVAADGAVLFDPTLDVFKPIADEPQPLFQAWREELQTETFPSPDGSKHHPWYQRILSEARAPVNKSSAAATDVTIDLAQAMAVAGLAKMRDPKIAIADWLTSQDGSKSIGKNAAAHAATAGAHTTNCRVESNFGSFDHVLRTFESICIENASGIAQQMRMHHFDSRTDHVVHDRRKAKQAAKPTSSSVGFFDALSEQVQQSGIEMARLLKPEARADARADRKEQAEYRAMMRARNVETQLDALAKKGALALERYDEYANGQSVSTTTEMVAALGEIPALTHQQTFLRTQIEMRVNGLGWSDLATTWQSTGETLQDSVRRLKGHLKEVLVEEAVRTRRGDVKWINGQLVKPSSAPLPDFQAKTLKQLGTPTEDSKELAARALCSPEQVATASQRERERREAAGFTDAVQMKMPKAPTLPLPVGTQLEVCWGKFISTVDNKTRVKMWCP